MAARRTTGRATGLGVTVVGLVFAAGLALPDDDPDPDACRGVTRFSTPQLVALAGLAGCAGLPDAAARGEVQYDRRAQCWVLRPRLGEPALVVWPDGSRPLGGPAPAVQVPERSAGGRDHPAGVVTSGDTVEGLGPVLPAGAVDRVSAGCRHVVGDRTAALRGVRVVPRGEEGTP